MRLWWKERRAQWDLWADGTDRDVTSLDAQLHQLCRDSASLIEAEPGRAGELWRRRAARVLVDSHPEVSARRNRIDRAFFVENRRDDPGTVRRHVLELMSLRDSAARDLGHASYPALVMWDEEVDLQTVRRLITDIVRRQADERRDAMARLGLHELTDWFPRLHDVDIAPSPFEVEPLARRTLDGIGLSQALPRICFHVRPGRTSGFVLDCGPADIRLFLSRSADPLLLFHELGHAVGRTLIAGPDIERLLPTSTDETFAQTLELIAAQTAEFDAIYEDPHEARRAQRIRDVLENARLFASFEFEMKLWQNRSQPEKLYRDCYAEVGIDVADETRWPLDSFRSLDPLYVHNYIMGRTVGAATLAYLRESVSRDPSPAWGQWLIASYYRDGARTSLPDKTAHLGPADPLSGPSQHTTP